MIFPIHPRFRIQYLNTFLRIQSFSPYYLLSLLLQATAKKNHYLTSPLPSMLPVKLLSSTFYVPFLGRPRFFGSAGSPPVVSSSAFSAALAFVPLLTFLGRPLLFLLSAFPA